MEIHRAEGADADRANRISGTPEETDGLFYCWFGRRGWNLNSRQILRARPDAAYELRAARLDRAEQAAFSLSDVQICSAGRTDHDIPEF